MPHDPTLLLADIGGTHARLVLWRGGAFVSEPAHWLAADHPDLSSAIGLYLTQTQGAADRLDGVAVCGAGPVFDGRIKMTNSPWIIDQGEIAAAAGTPDPLVVNDFTAMAMGVILVDENFRETVHAGTARAHSPIGVMGPGTGLGVSALIPDGRGSVIPLDGEGGHVDLPASSDLEIAILRHVRSSDDHVSVEDILSGPGLVTLYSAVRAVSGATAEDPIDAPEIARRAGDGTCAHAEASIRLFSRWLGVVAGNLALTLGARGGVYLAGGILPKWGPLFDRAQFRDGFEAKGRFRSYMEQIPVTLITGGRPALLGLAALWDQRRGG